jgi:hypothetical protein
MTGNGLGEVDALPGNGKTALGTQFAFNPAIIASPLTVTAAQAHAPPTDART